MAEQESVVPAHAATIPTGPTVVEILLHKPPIALPTPDAFTAEVHTPALVQALRVILPLASTDAVP